MTPENKNVKYAMQVLATPVASVGQRCACDCRRLPVRAPMTEQVQRIILRDADQREPESKCDAVHGAEQRAHHGQAGEPRAGERQHTEHDAADAAIRDQQQQDHADGSRRAEGLRLSARARFHQHRELAGAAHCHPHGRAAWHCGEGTGELLKRGSLTVWIECRRLGFGNQQCAPSAAIEPDVVLAPRFLHRLPALQKLQHFQRRIARQPRLEEAAGRRREIASACEQLGMQVLSIEALRIDCR